MYKVPLTTLIITLYYGGVNRIYELFVFAVAEVSVKPIFPSFQNFTLIQEGDLKQELLLWSS